MATLAEQIAEGKLKPPPNVEEGIEDVKRVAREQHEAHTLTLRLGFMVENGKRKELTEADRERIKGWLADTYAYRFEPLDDGSVVEISLPKHGSQVKLVAHEDLLMAGLNSRSGVGRNRK